MAIIMLMSYELCLVNSAPSAVILPLIADEAHQRYLLFEMSGAKRKTTRIVRYEGDDVTISPRHDVEH